MRMLALRTSPSAFSLLHAQSGATQLHISCALSQRRTSLASTSSDPWRDSAASWKRPTTSSCDTFVALVSASSQKSRVKASVSAPCAPRRSPDRGAR